MIEREQPLKGIRVLDFSWMLAGPYATRILADFGAEVIKIQSGKTATGAEQNSGAYFATWNRNKLGVTIDMDSAEGKALALDLSAISDVVIENFTPRVMDNWELTYDGFQKRKKDIIIVRMSAMGQSGPWRNFAALGPTIQACPITYLTSMTEEKPVGIGYAYSDTVAGLYAAFAILAALEHRDKTGQGICIDLSELEAMASLIGPALMQASATGTGPSPCANKPAGTPAAPYGCFRCSGDDRWCVIAVFTEEQWYALCTILDMQEAAEEFSSPHFIRHFTWMNKQAGRITNKNGICGRYRQQAQQAGIPAGIVRNAMTSPMTAIY
jgi:crotonobetainyl-CoA:carnitine CoA-transferase CaiB-like acyl-CoA transferase